MSRHTSRYLGHMHSNIHAGSSDGPWGPCGMWLQTLPPTPASHRSIEAPAIQLHRNKTAVVGETVAVAVWLEMEYE